MKRIYSLKGRNVFRQVYLKGRKLQDTGIRVYIFSINKCIHVKPVTVSDRSSASKRIKIAVAPDKSYGKAYARNRVKRRIRAICSGLFDEFKEGFYIIIRVDHGFRDLSFQEERRIVRSLLAHAGLISGDGH